MNEQTKWTILKSTVHVLIFPSNEKILSKSNKVLTSRWPNEVHQSRVIRLESDELPRLKTQVDAVRRYHNCHRLTSLQRQLIRRRVGHRDTQIWSEETEHRITRRKPSDDTTIAFIGQHIHSLPIFLNSFWLSSAKVSLTFGKNEVVHAEPLRRRRNHGRVHLRFFRQRSAPCSTQRRPHARHGRFVRQRIQLTKPSHTPKTYHKLFSTKFKRKIKARDEEKQA